MSKLNILQLITGLDVGGAERVVLDISIGLDKQKYSNYVIALADKDKFLHEYQRNNVNVSIFGNKKNIFSFFNMIFKLHVFINKKNIQIVHAHMTHAMIAAVLVKIIHPNIKIVFTSHSLNVGSKFRELMIFLLKPYRNIDILFSANVYKYIYKKSYEVIPNGINYKKYTQSKQNNKEFTFITIGRLQAMKNHIFLLDIMKDLKDINCKLLIVGEGLLRSKLEKQITDFDLIDKVELLGLREDIPELLAKADCFLLPSLWEGMPIVLLEAGASNIPIISTNVGSISSLIDNETGYLVTLEQFKAQMIYLIENQTESKQKALKLRNKIEQQYSIESVVTKYEDIYSSLFN